MGGHVTGLCRVYDDGQIYFLVKTFFVNGKPLKKGDNLIDAGHLVAVNGQAYLEGHLEGILEYDSVPLDVTFRIYNKGDYKGSANISVDIVTAAISPKSLWTIVAGIGGVLIILIIIKSKEEKQATYTLPLRGALRCISHACLKGKFEGIFRSYSNDYMISFMCSAVDRVFTIYDLSICLVTFFVSRFFRFCTNL